MKIESLFFYSARNSKCGCSLNVNSSGIAVDVHVEHAWHHCTLTKLRKLFIYDWYTALCKVFCKTVVNVHSDILCILKEFYCTPTLMGLTRFLYERQSSNIAFTVHLQHTLSFPSQSTWKHFFPIGYMFCNVNYIFCWFWSFMYFSEVKWGGFFKNIFPFLYKHNWNWTTTVQTHR